MLLLQTSGNPLVLLLINPDEKSNQAFFDQKLIFARMNHRSGFVKNFNEKWNLSYSLSGLIDVEQASKDYELLVKYGAMTLNEYRRACGLDETDDENHERFYTESYSYFSPK